MTSALTYVLIDGTAVAAPTATSATSHVTGYPRLALFAAATVGLASASTVSAVAHTSGTTVAFWRLVIGAISWQLLAVYKHCTLDRSGWRLALLPGVAFGLEIVLFFNAVRLLGVARAELLVALAPIIVGISARQFMGERIGISAALLTGIVLGGVAATVIDARQGSSRALVPGLLFACGALSSWSMFLLTLKRARRRLSTVEAMSGIMTVAAVVGGCAVAMSGAPLRMPGEGWLCASILAFGTGGAAFAVLVWVVKDIPVTVASIALATEPAIATVWAYLVVGQTITFGQIVGLTVAVAAIGIILCRAVPSALPEGTGETRP